jgi:hypothetical protein
LALVSKKTLQEKNEDEKKLLRKMKCTKASKAAKASKALVMTLVHAPRPYIVHGKPLPIANAMAFVGERTSASVRTHSWLVDAWRPHSCGVSACILNRARLRMLWARVAGRVAVVAEAARALRAHFPPEIAEHVLSFVKADRRYGVPAE